MDGSPRIARTDTAALFTSGGDQAVRLPEAYRFEGQKVSIRKQGDQVILEPVEPRQPPETDEEWQAFWKDIDDRGDPDRPFPDPPPQTITPIKTW